MKPENREALKAFLMIGVPAGLFISLVLPKAFVIPIAVTLYFGTLMGAYIIEDLKPEQENWKPKVIIICSIVILSVWLSLFIEFYKNT